MSARSARFLSRAQLEGLTTKRLLAYRDSLHRKFHEGPSYEVLLYGGSDVGTHDEVTKQSPEWREAMTLTKEVLATREHVPRNGE